MSQSTCMAAWTAYKFHVDIQIKELLEVFLGCSPFPGFGYEGSCKILSSKFSGADSRYCRAENPRTHSLPDLRPWRDQCAELEPRGVQELESLFGRKVIRNHEYAMERKHRRRGNSQNGGKKYGVNQRLQVVYPRTDLTSVEDLTRQGNWGTTAVAEVLGPECGIVKSHRMESAKANHEKRAGPTQWKGRNAAWNGSKLLHIQAGRVQKMAVNNATAVCAQAGAKILYSNIRTRGVIESAIRGRQRQRSDNWRTIRRSDRSFHIAHAVVLAAQWVVVKLLGNGYGGDG
ncbi:hypothetical protein BO83DRAFT_401820 [Aspergillus eucalypticola CBS 122712]|uniref:Uncharacterized protein n=1 Tax=Aspergillus eucalypticola (strain CBS 122712 / IBT 29274) TaxID=1448314 RepID=A0A317UW33_ASPEC|nr:uncharacterized protein BO83DRAFT_401820 [Aspergillus eucalypticola CBS 122712]PWY65865.1 hypothetical protein BO83DRAFT_401820 [Aspergillus eucalypticola CBS 122712]